MFTKSLRNFAIPKKNRRMCADYNTLKNVGFFFLFIFHAFFYFVSRNKSLGKEMEASSEGERLTFPFVGKMYDISNAALFFAHNGRLDSAQEQLKGQRERDTPE